MPFLRNDRPLVMAHRGNQAEHPENSLEAMTSAVQLGVDVLETDVRLTSDNEFVIFHDETVDRVSDGVGAVHELTLAEIQGLDIGFKVGPDQGFPFRGKGYRVPTLSDFFDSFPEQKINIDIKDLSPTAPKQLAKVIQEHKAEDRVWVGSFHPEQTYRFRRLLPQVPTAATAEEVRQFLVSMKLRLLFRVKPEYQGFQVPPSHEDTTIVTSKFVRMAHKKGVGVMVWTINDEEVMKELVGMGVDGIFTDHPERLLKVLNDLGSKES